MPSEDEISVPEDQGVRELPWLTQESRRSRRRASRDSAAGNGNTLKNNQNLSQEIAEKRTPGPELGSLTNEKNPRPGVKTTSLAATGDSRLKDQQP